MTELDPRWEWSEVRTGDGRHVRHYRYGGKL